MIPAHNAAETIEAAILSVLEQDFQDFELWILENGSSDRTVEIARKYEGPRVKVFELGPIGFQKALTWGIEMAQTPYIARMDADDICLPFRFSSQLWVLEKHPEYVLCGSDVMVLTPFNHIMEIRHAGRRSGEVGFYHMSDIPGKEKRFFGDPNVIFRREAALKVGLYDDRFPVGDVSLWIRMLKVSKGYELAKPTLLYRWIPRSMSNTLKFNQQTLACRLAYYGNHYLHAEEILNLPEQKISPEGPPDFWIRVALIELLGGNKAAYKIALNKSGKQITLVDRLKMWFYPLYRLYHRAVHGVNYIPRKDLEIRYLGRV